jgi:hypothetical protein
MPKVEYRAGNKPSVVRNPAGQSARFDIPQGTFGNIGKFTPGNLQKKRRDEFEKALDLPFPNRRPPPRNTLPFRPAGYRKSLGSEPGNRIYAAKSKGKNEPDPQEAKRQQRIAQQVKDEQKKKAKDLKREQKMLKQEQTMDRYHKHRVEKMYEQERINLNEKRAEKAGDQGVIAANLRLGWGLKRGSVRVRNGFLLNQNRARLAYEHGVHNYHGYAMDVVTDPLTGNFKHSGRIKPFPAQQYR